jgi:hypothetical protein
MSNTEQRIDELERQYRRLRRLTTSIVIGVAVLLGLGAAIIMVSARYGMPGTVAKIVSARQFVLRGEDGAVRGMWGTEEDGTLRLMLQDARGRARAKLSLFTDGSSGFTFSDSVGQPRMVFALLPDETASIVLADARGKTRSVLGISAGGNPTLVFADKDGATRAGLGVDGRGVGTFTLVDGGGRDLAQPESEVPYETGTNTDTVTPAPTGPARR